MGAPLGVAARCLTTSAKEMRLARTSCSISVMALTATRAALRGTLNQGLYLGLGLGEGEEGSQG